MNAHTILDNTLQAGTQRSALPGRLFHRAGFSMTELLVVIGIIVLLASILLVALGQVRHRALETTTLATMRGFAASADAFQQEHGQYPGVIPERVLALALQNQQVHLVNASDDANSPDNLYTISSTQNALLQMMGGYSVLAPDEYGSGSPNDQHYVESTFTYEFEIGDPANPWRLKVDLNRIGEGPMIDGRAYAPYFTPASREIGVVEGVVGQTNWEPAPGQGWVRIPTLIDAWGQPILYTRRMRSSGPLVHEIAERPQFSMEGLRPYLFATRLGELGMSQLGERGSIFLHGLAQTGEFEDDHFTIFAQMLRHPSFGPPGENPLIEANWDRVAPRGEYVLISAGRDGIYFSAVDGPGSHADPLFENGFDPIFFDYGPGIFEEFNDIIIFGGG